MFGLLWGCFVTALVLKRKAIKQACCDAGAKITSTQEPYITQLETDDQDARTQAYKRLRQDDVFGDENKIRLFLSP